MRGACVLLHVLLLALAVGAGPSGCGRRGPSDPRVLRVGHLPNLTHAHALLLRGREATPAAPAHEWYAFHAGPSAMEALLAGDLDLSYVGPSPALNAHVRSRGRDVRVVSGATRGGSALVVRRGAGIRGARDLRGKVVASPQLGNTQDVSLRSWLLDAGLSVTVGGGDVRIQPTKNPEILTLFARGELDGAWTVEPWVSRLEVEGEGELLVEEKDTLTTVLVASARVLAERPEVVRAFLVEHAEATRRLGAEREATLAEVSARLRGLTRGALPPEVVARARGRLTFDDRVTREEFGVLAEAARRVGLLRSAADLANLVVTP
jgi:NitT/TauT family transport system substrate-binding protein